uniref:hypothetical protein n=1 Tax=Granulicella cerasi TaxID=741063 RepID=UPI0036F26CA0
MLMLALATSALAHAQAKSSVKVKLNGETILLLGTTTHRVMVKVHTHEAKAPEGTDLYELQRNSPCTASRIPCVLTDSLELSVNGHPVWTQYSAYADLGDMGQLTLSRSGSDYLLTITGGDAAGSYIAKLRFNQSRVLSRVVAPGEDSTQPSERTYYYNSKRFE